MTTVAALEEQLARLARLLDPAMLAQLTAQRDRAIVALIEQGGVTYERAAQVAGLTRPRVSQIMAKQAPEVQRKPGRPLKRVIGG